MTKPHRLRLERIAECERLRASYVVREPVWSEPRGDRDAQSADCGDYVCAVFHVCDMGWCWTTGFKIVNELFGEGRVQGAHGSADTPEAARAAAITAVIADRERRKTKVPR